MKKIIVFLLLMHTRAVLPSSQNLHHTHLTKMILITSGSAALGFGTYYANKWGEKRFMNAYKKQNHQEEYSLSQNHFFKRSLRNILTIITGADRIKENYKPLLYKIWSIIPGSKCIEQYSGVSKIIPPFVAQSSSADTSSTPRDILSGTLNSEPTTLRFHPFTESAMHPGSYVMDTHSSPVHIPCIQTTLANMLENEESQNITAYAFAVCNRSCSERSEFVYCLLTRLQTNTVYLTFLTDNPLDEKSLPERQSSQESIDIARVKNLLRKNAVPNYSINVWAHHIHPQ